MSKGLSLLNKAGYLFSISALLVVGLAYQPVSNIFSTSSGESCQIGGNGRLTASNSTEIYANRAPRSVGPLSLSVPAGQYDVYFQSYDNHSVNGGQNQQEEIWTIEGSRDGSVVWTSVPTRDVAENKDLESGLLQAKVNIPQLDSVVFRHASNTNNPQSVTPVCAAFERAEVPPTACQLGGPNGVVVNGSNEILLANGNRQAGPFSINLMAGTYDIDWQSFDDHSAKTGQGQTQEIWKVVYLKNGVEVGSSSATSDIPENVNDASGTLANQTVPMSDQVIFRHAAGTNVGPQSVVPSCVSFDKHPEPVVTCDNLVATQLQRNVFRFGVAATSANGGAVSSYTFNFGDGSVETSTSNVINHTYTAPGSYNVKVTLNTNIGPINSASCNKSVTVNEKSVDLELKKYVSVDNGNTFADVDNSANAPRIELGKDIIWKLVLTNKGPNNATGVTVADLLPAGLDITSHSGDGTLTGATWNVGRVNTNQTLELVLTTSSNTVGLKTNAAGVATANEKDIDSTPGDAIDNNEDDEDPASVVVFKPVPQPASLGDRVWFDANNNGQQDAGEPGVSGVTVILMDRNGNELDRQETGPNGYYLFDNLAAGDYKVTFVQPDNREFTVANNGNDNSDSDANQVTGMSQVVTLAEGEANKTIDAGLVKIVVPVFECTGLTVEKIDFRTYKATATFNVENANIVEYLFTNLTPNGINTVRSDTPMSTIVASEEGVYGFTAQVVTDQGTSPITGIGTCQDSFTVAPLIDLELVKHVDFGDSGFQDANTEAEAPSGMVGSSATWKIVVSNNGPDTATGVEVSDLVPAGVSYQAHSTATGSFNTANAIWTVGTLNAGDSAELTLITLVEEIGIITNWAGVTAVDQPDADSTPTDAIDGNEDDEDPAAIISEEAERASLGDRVWLDLNKNGIQDAGEPGVDDVLVILQDENGDEVDRMLTNGGGNYQFENLDPGVYKVTFELPSGYSFTDVNVDDDESDSDADQVSGMSPLVTLVAGENNLTVDAGLVADEVEEPVHKCVALNVVKLGGKTFRLEIATFQKDATATSYTFTVNGKVVKISDQATMKFEALKSGSYTISATVEFDVDGEAKTVSCPETVINIAEQGQVLGTTTPTILPNTGPGAITGIIGTSLAGAGLASLRSSRKQLRDALKK